MIFDEMPRNCWTCKKREKKCYFRDRFREANQLYDLIKKVYPDVVKNDLYLICEHWISHRKDRRKPRSGESRASQEAKGGEKEGENV